MRCKMTPPYTVVALCFESSAAYTAPSGYDSARSMLQLRMICRAFFADAERSSRVDGATLMLRRMVRQEGGREI